MKQNKAYMKWAGQYSPDLYKFFGVPNDKEVELSDLEVKSGPEQPEDSYPARYIRSIQYT